MCRMKTGKKKFKTHNCTMSQSCSPNENTWIQINTVSIPPTPPKTSRLPSMLQRANPPPPAPPPQSLSSGRTGPAAAERTRSLLPTPNTWLEVEKEERCWEKNGSSHFSFPSTIINKKKLLKSETLIPLCLLPFLKPSVLPTKTSPNSL